MARCSWIYRGKFALSDGQTVMTTSHLVTVPSLTLHILAGVLRPLSHPPQVGGGYGQTEVDVRGVLQLLEVLRCDGKNLDSRLCVLPLPGQTSL